MFATGICRRTFSLLQAKSPPTEEVGLRWKQILRQNGLGKPLLHAHQSWSQHVNNLHSHAARCVLCRDRLVAYAARMDKGHLTCSSSIALPTYVPRAECVPVPVGDMRMCTREEARSSHMTILTDISWTEAPNASNRFTALGEVAEDATVSMFGSANHSERVRLSLPLAMRYLGLKEVQKERFWKAILARERNDVTDRFFSDEGTRLDRHIVLSSLFATSQPVSSLGMTGHDYVIGRDNPIRKAPGSELLVENPDGITVLDVMRNATLTAGEGLHERELLPFSGIDWDPSEWVDTTDGPQEIELITGWNADLSGGKGRLYA